MTDCTSCGATLASTLVCEACGALQDRSAHAAGDPFAALGIERAYDVDAAELKKRLLALQRLMHPDFFGGAAPAQRERAERNTAELNAAHRDLSDDARRADLLLRTLGGPDEQAVRQMPQEFLMEVLEWNEALEEAREQVPAPGTDAAAKLDALQAQLTAERADALLRVEKLLVPLPDAGTDALVAARKELNSIRYLDRALSTLRELKLDAAKSAR